MKKSFWLFLIIGFTQLVTAQYTEVINSNRPSFSKSPYSVGSNVYQVETGLFFRSTQIKKRFSNPQSFGQKLSLRYSHFDEKLEFNLDMVYQFDQRAFRTIYTSIKNLHGFSHFTVGAKYLIFKKEYQDFSKEFRSWKKRNQFDKNRLIPSVGVYFGINTPLVDGYHTPKFSPKLAVYLQNNITDRYAILSNFIADKLGTYDASYTYIITETYTLNDKYSIFLENLGRYNVNYGNELHFAAGGAYLKSKNLQFDASLRFLIEGKATGLFLSTGLSWRLDKHKKYIIKKLDAQTKAAVRKDKNRDKEVSNKKKNALQSLYRKTKKIRTHKKIKQTGKIKKTKRRIKKLKSSRKKDKKDRTKPAKKKRKGLFAKRTKRSKKDKKNKKDSNQND